MNKFLILIFLHLTLLSKTNAQNNPVCNCRCDYVSHYSREKYMFKADSIAKQFKKQNYKHLKVIGARGFGSATLLFVVKVNGKNKGFDYDLVNMKRTIIAGAKLDHWLKNVIADSAFLHTAKQDVHASKSHDFSFFLSFNYPDSKFTEICHSQLITDFNRPLTIALMYYGSGFRP